MTEHLATGDVQQLRAEMNARFDAVDARFETMEARFDAKLERSMREQMNRFIVVQVALMTALLTAQQLLGR